LKTASQHPAFLMTLCFNWLPECDTSGEASKKYMFLEVMEEEQDLPFILNTSESTVVRLCMSPVTVGCVEGQGLINNVM